MMIRSFLRRRASRQATSYREGVIGYQLVISAQTKPASSRAIAVTATAAGSPRAVIVF